MSDLSATLAQGLAGLTGAFTSTQRLYHLQGEGEFSSLLVEAWSLREGVNDVFELHLSTLSLRAGLDIHAMLARPVVLHTVLADGSRFPRAGLVMAATADDADGGLARYTLTIQPWLALLAHTTRSQAWQDRSLVQIVESVFSRYTPHAAWTWAPCTEAHLATSPFRDAAGLRPYTVQYRESDLAFITRLLAEEGLVWRFETDVDAPAGHRLVILADTPAVASTPADPTSASSLGGRGIRYHRASAAEAQDTLQALGGSRSLQPAISTVLAWDPQAKRAVAASVPTTQAFGGPNAPHLEDYRLTRLPPGAGTAQAERAAVLAQQAFEARHKRWLGRSTVRTFTAGTRFELTDSDLDLGLPTSGDQPGAIPAAQRNHFLLLQVTHAGINNLPKELNERIASTFDEGGAGLLQPWVPAEVRQQARDTGYGNAFAATRVAVPWRPLPPDPPLPPGMLTATVVGPQGQTQASGAEEIHTDGQGRIRIQHDFQRAGHDGPDTTLASPWVRVLQRLAGAGMGLQFIPRIGQQVLLDFIDGDITRPLVVGALYDGRGEAGVPATPGGKAAQADTSALAHSGDHRPGAQANLSGGHSPAWHGAGAAATDAGGQNNAAALSGYKSQEFGGSGYNQLVFDDSNGQLRTQLATTQHATQLNLGHLIHQADNHRGGFRGLGFELRTDAWGAVRSGSGILLSSYTTRQSEPAGDNAAGIALMGQLKHLGQTYSQAAATHQATQLAAHLGGSKTNQSAADDKAAPLSALHTVLKGMVADTGADLAQGDARAKNTATGQDKLPHTTDPIVSVSAQAGLATVAGQDIRLSADEGITLAAGQHLEQATGGALRIHTGQAIGMLAGAVQPGSEAAGKGLTLIAGSGDIDLQAQAGTMQVAAQGDVSIQSQSAHIDWAAAKKIVLSTAGGASVTLEGGNIVIECPGKISVFAGKKSFVGPERVSYALPGLPAHICKECLLRARQTGSRIALA